MAPRTDRLFVYGTLQSGFAPHDHLLGDRVVEIHPAHLEGFRILHLPEGYPAVFRAAVFKAAVFSGSEGDRVRGELLRLDEAQLPWPALDRYEGSLPDDPQRLYDRQRVTVVLDGGDRDGEAVEAWCYVSRAGWEEAVARGGVEVPGGDWRGFVRGAGDR